MRVTRRASAPAGLLAARRGLIVERIDGPGRFVATGGPVVDYTRTVSIDPDGSAVQVVSYRMALPLLGWLLALPVRHELGRADGDANRFPWWGPPDVLDRQAWTAMSVLACLSAVVGYLSTLLTQTITYSAEEFHAGTGAQGVALAVVRGDVLLSVGLVALADRRGRRAIALVGATGGCLLTALGGLSPSLPWLAASQVIARGFVTAASIAAAVLVAEVMPKNARAWAIGIIAIASAAGGGVCVLGLPLAGLGVRGWRLLYGGAMLWLVLVLPVRRHLEESRRYLELPVAHHRPGLRSMLGRRMLMLAAANFLFQIFITPAAQFRNDYLRRERGFSPGRITLFTVLTVIPGLIGIVLGGRLADTRGRRRVAMGAVIGAAVGAVISFVLGGWGMWAGGAVANLTGAAVVPALAVYGPELFSTRHRGAANGILTGAGRIGGVLGLLLVGGISEWLGRFGPAFAVVAIGPVALVVLIKTAFPETAHRSLEELNEPAPDG